MDGSMWLGFSLWLLVLQIICAETQPANQKSHKHQALRSDTTSGVAVISVPRDQACEPAVQHAIAAVMGRPPSVSPWVGIISPTDRVGIKISADGADKRVVKIIIQSLQKAGLPVSNIFIWDRSQHDLRKNGWLTRQGQSTLPGVAVEFIPLKAGYDPERAIYSVASGSLIWGDRNFQPRTSQLQISNMSHLSCILTRQADKVIHLGVARVANGIGLHGAIGGALIDNLDNWRRFYGKGAEVCLDELWAAASLDSQCLLHIIDARVVQLADGPRRNVLYERPLGVLLASRDPSALDRRLVEIIDPLVVAEKLPSPKRHTQWLRASPGNATLPKNMP